MTRGKHTYRICLLLGLVLGVMGLSIVGWRAGATESNTRSNWWSTTAPTAAQPPLAAKAQPVMAGVAPRLVAAAQAACTNGSITSIVADGLGNLYVGGTFTLINNVPASRVAKWDGASWSALGDGSALANNGVDNNVNALALSGNNLYVGGSFQQARSSAVTTVPASRIAIWNTMASTWSALGDPANVNDNGVNNAVQAIAVNGSNVFVGGNFTEARTNAGTKPLTSRIAMWNGAAWSALGDGTNVNNNGVGNPVSAIAIDSLSNVYIGGNFTQARKGAGMTVPTARVARWNGTDWFALGDGSSVNNNGVGGGGVNAIAIDSSDDVFIGFASSVLEVRTNATTKPPASRVAKWDGAAWSVLGDPASATANGVDFDVSELVISGSNLFVGGRFSQARTNAGTTVASRGVAMWNGAAWSALGDGSNVNNNGVNDGMFPSVTAFALSGANVIVGGTFTQVRNSAMSVVDAVNIASWNGASWSDLDTSCPPNTAPMITPIAQTVQEGSPVQNLPIATVNDAETAPGSLTVNVNGGAMATVNGVTVSNLVNMGGNVTADISAACGATIGTTNFTINVSDGALTTPGTLVVTVNANTPPVLTYSSPQTVALGNGLLVNPATGPTDNGGPPVVGMATILPATFTGTVMANAAGVVTISNAAPLGSYTVTVPVTDNCGVTVNAQFTLDVTCPTITLPALPGGTGGTPYNQSVAANPPGTYTYAVTAGALPPGLALDANTGAVTGTPTLAGSFSFTVQATLTAAPTCTGSQAYTVVIACPVVSLAPGPLINGTVGVPYTQTIVASPGGGNYSYAVTNGSLPPGLSLNATSGEISGTPSQTGNFTFRITATGFGSCSGSRDYQIVVPTCDPITVNPPGLLGGTVGAAYTDTVSAAPAGVYSFAVSSGALPPGLTLNAATGVLSGTPTDDGTFSFRVTATLDGCSGFRDYTLGIACQTITLPAPPLAAGTAGTAYTASVAVPPAGAHTYSLTAGNLPAGLTLNASTGAISGLPSATGTTTFTVKAQAANGCSGTQTYTITIGCPTVSLTAPPLPTGTVGTAYTATVAASPAGGSYTYAVSAGTLPAGLNLNPATGVLSGTPTANGASTFTITAIGFGGCPGSQAYTITVGGAGCPTITLPATLLGGTVGQVYTQSVMATPTGSYSYAVTEGSLPPGVSLIGAIGLLYGYPTAAGNFTFKITATQGACSGSQEYTVVIGAAAVLAKPGDFDGDGKADTAVFRASRANWLIVQSSDNAEQSLLWGTAGDRQAAGDYDGDGKLDLAVFTTAGHWRIKRSSDGATVDQLWGLPTDVPVAGDYDGDGKTDIAVWRGTQGHWYIVNSSDGAVQVVQWGMASEPYGDVAAPGDYDGDKKTDLAVFRKLDGTWYIRRSSDGTIQTQAWGLATDTPVQGDYDGDGQTDIAVWRGETSTWFIIRSGSGLLQMASWGASYTPYNDQPVPGDYDGDGKTDIAVWRPGTGTWYSLNSSDGSTRVRQHGQAGDTPVTARIP